MGPFVASADDNNGVPHGVGGSFADPRADFILPSTGTYTLMVFDFFGQGPTPQFEIHASGIRGCNRPPDCSAAAPSLDEIWPPNHKFVPVTITGVTDPDGDPVTIAITGIFQDEPLDTLGDGSFEPDGIISDDGTTAFLRAERSGTKKVPGNGRVYRIEFTATDGNGGECTGTVTVCVPHDQRPGHVCVDDGTTVDSTGGS
jgi:hypothetical protein